jgi:Zn-dependent peptidase ImmA (M78 family)
MNASSGLFRKAIRGALATRTQGGVLATSPICVYDVADRLGIEVKFCPGNSFGGMYSKPSTTILVPSMRPAGRQAFTCAHEIGHWYFGHGTRIDDVDLMEWTSNDVDEQLANTFAAYLLMPARAVRKAFSDRCWSLNKCSPIQMYMAAGQLGVGYSTLVQHMRYSLNLLSERDAQRFLKVTPKHIRHDVLGNSETKFLVIADLQWSDIAIDIQVGDVAILPAKTAVEGRSVEVLGENKLGRLIRGCSPGISRAELLDSSWAVYVRVSRNGFVGRSQYRHLEDPDVDDSARVDQCG